MEETIKEMSAAAGYKFTLTADGKARLDAIREPEPYIEGTLESVGRYLVRILRLARTSVSF